MLDVTCRASLVLRAAFTIFLLLLAVFAVQGCGRRSPTEPTFDYVHVDAGPPIAVGDTVRVFAGTYTAYGFLLRWDGHVDWAISDSTIARLEPTSRADERIARGLRVGTAIIRATISGKSDEADLRVIP